MLVEIGDIVKLKEPWKGWTHGIVVEIVDTQEFVGMATPEAAAMHYLSPEQAGAKAIPRTISLHLFKPIGTTLEKFDVPEFKEIERKEIGGILNIYAESPNPIPSYTDFNVDELILVKRAKKLGYELENTDLERERKKLQGMI